MTALIDTCILSDLAAGAPGARQRLAQWLSQNHGIAVPRVAVYEFRRGVLCGSVDPNGAVAIEQFIAHYTIAELDAAAWDIAADLWAKTFQAGRKPRKDGDILIAATAIRWGYAVATSNVRDFEKIHRIDQRLVVVPW